MTLELSKLPLAIHKIDLVKSGALFEKKPEKKIAMGTIKAEDKAFSWDVTGDMCTQGINDAEFGEGKNKRTNYSIGLTLEEQDQEFIQKCLDVLTSFCNDNDAEDYEIVDPVKDSDMLYVKLKTDRSGKKFLFKSNTKITPKNYSEVANCARVNVVLGMNVYFNLDEKKAGVSFNTEEINFDPEDDAPPMKKTKYSSK
tara:strand:- start:5551 stop:6144 length:594 start_codon:yes stop_codon:yes gene_type:complete